MMLTPVAQGFAVCSQQFWMRRTAEAAQAVYIRYAYVGLPAAGRPSCGMSVACNLPSSMTRRRGQQRASESGQAGHCLDLPLG